MERKDITVLSTSLAKLAKNNINILEISATTTSGTPTILFEYGWVMDSYGKVKWSRGAYVCTHEDLSDATLAEDIDRIIDIVKETRKALEV